jgi:hypothetical protein
MGYVERRFLGTEQAEAVVNRLSTTLLVFFGAVATAHAFDPSALDSLRNNNHCAKCDLSDADLGGASGLTQAQFDQTCNDATGFPDKTRLPKGLTLKRCR